MPSAQQKGSVLYPPCSTVSSSSVYTSLIRHQVITAIVTKILDAQLFLSPQCIPSWEQTHVNYGNHTFSQLFFPSTST